VGAPVPGLGTDMIQNRGPNNAHSVQPSASRKQARQHSAGVTALLSTSRPRATARMPFTSGVCCGHTVCVVVLVTVVERVVDVVDVSCQKSDGCSWFSSTSVLGYIQL
jgi:hypothetical protein